MSGEQELYMEADRKILPPDDRKARVARAGVVWDGFTYAAACAGILTILLSRFRV